MRKSIAKEVMSEKEISTYAKICELRSIRKKGGEYNAKNNDSWCVG